MKTLKQLALVLTALTLSLSSFAQRSPKPELSQDYEIYWAEKHKSKTRPAEYIGTDMDGNHIYHAYRTRMIPLPFYTRVVMKEYIRVYDPDMNFLEDIKLEGLPHLKGSNWSMHKLVPRNFKKFAGKYYVMTQESRGKKRDGYDMTMRELDMDTKSIGKSKKLFRFGGAKNRMTGSMNVYLSPDGSKALFYYIIKTKRRKDKAKLQYFLVDENLKVVDDGVIRLKERRSDIGLDDVVLDNTGKFSFLVSYEKSSRDLRKERKKKRKAKKKKGGQKDDEATQLRNYSFYNGPEKKIQPIDFTIKERTIGGIMLRESDENGFTIFGSFASNNRAHYLENTENYIFTARMKFDGELEYIEMEDEVVAEKKKLSRRERRKQRRRNRKKARKVRGYAGYVHFNELVFDHDSNYYLTGEYYRRYVYTTTTTTTGANGVTTTRQETRTHHDHGNIMVFKFTRDGKLLWKSSVYKDNDFSDPGYSFFRRTTFKSFISQSNKLHLFFNDNASYMENRSEVYKKHATRREGIFVTSLGKDDGKVERHLLGSRYFGRKYYHPHIPMIQQRDDGNIIVMGYRGITAKKVKAGVVRIY